MRYGSGSRFETVFESGTTYLIRLVNGAADTHFKFMIDSHTMTVIANDFVPIVPYTTDVLSIGIGERYDVIITANATADNYWLRAIPQTSCSDNDETDNIRGSKSTSQKNSLIRWIRDLNHCREEKYTLTLSSQLFVMTQLPPTSRPHQHIPTPTAAMTRTSRIWFLTYQ